MSGPISRRELVLRFDRKLSRVIGEDLPIFKTIKRFVVKSGGKRIRPILHYYLARLYGYSGGAWEDVGAIGELIHAASLLHDDVIDNSDKRRGQPSINALHGNKTAILSGDYLLACGLDHLASLDRGAELLPVFTRTVQSLAVGELIQMQWEGRFETDEKTYERIIHGKTASLFGAMSEAARLLAGENIPARELKEHREFGERLGRVFQIRDDFLDYFSAADKAGKDLYQDFQRGLVTRPVIVLRKLASLAERRELARLWKSEARRQSPEGLAVWLTLAEKTKLRRKLATELETETHALMNFVRRYPPSPYQDVVIDQLAGLLVS